MLYSTYSRWEYTLVRVYFSELWSFTCQSPHLCAQTNQKILRLSYLTPRPTRVVHVIPQLRKVNDA